VRKKKLENSNDLLFIRSKASLSNIKKKKYFSMIIGTVYKGRALPISILS